MTSTRAGTPKYWLVLPDRVVPLREGRHVLGRGADADFCFTDDLELSRHHACLDVGSTEVFIEDLDSRNGTWVDEQRLTGRTAIAPGTVLRIGGIRLELQTVGGAGHTRRNTTAPEVPRARAARAAEMTVLPTQRKVDLGHGLLAAELAIDEGRTSEARRLLYEYMVLLDAAAERVPAALLDQAAAVAVKLAAKTGETRHTQWIAAAYRRAQRPISEQIRAQASHANLSTDVPDHLRTERDPRGAAEAESHPSGKH